jgi:hypothetical protein
MPALASPARLAALALAAVMLAAPAQARRVFPETGSPVAQCVAAAAAAGALEAVPDELMGRIALAETGRVDQDGAYRPWPWSIDADGEDYTFSTIQQAVAWAVQAPRRGVRFIDVGCLQVNLQFHPHAFRTLAEAFDPFDNAWYAARFLRSLYDGDGLHDWPTAVGLYHSYTPELAAAYRERVAELGRGIIAGITPGPLAHQMVTLGLLRLPLAGGGTLKIMLRRQPTAVGHRPASACRVATALAPLLAVKPRVRDCRD